MRLDDDYANAAYIEGAENYPDTWAIDAREFREVELACGRARINQPYGDGFEYDLFQPSARPAGTVIFVHGGYWKAFDRKDWSHFGAGVMEHDWAFALPSYPLAPDATIPQITVCVRQAVEAIADATVGPIVLTGHSAGGHLVARLAMADVELRADVVERIARIVPVSPLGDLRDLMETSMAAELGLRMDTAILESPTLRTNDSGKPVTVWVGGDERPKFLEQAQNLAKAWGCDHVVTKGRHHFDVIDDLKDPDGPLVRLLTGGQT